MSPVTYVLAMSVAVLAAVSWPVAAWVVVGLVVVVLLAGLLAAIFVGSER